MFFFLNNKIYLQYHDPWGKEGPGGLPWRHPGQIGQSFMKSMVN